MDRQRWIEFGDAAGRAGIVTYFGWGAIGRCIKIFHAISNWDVVNYPHKHLWMASQLMSLTLVLTMIGFTIVRFKPIRSAASIESRLSALGGTFLLLALTFIPDTARLPEIVRITGLVMTIIGFGLSVWVIRWLGRSFSIMAEARKLVTSGPYGWVRHPLYFTEEIGVLGLALLHFSPMAMFFLAAHWALQLRRMHNEELVLTEAFPEYAAYAAVTPRVIPHLVGRRAVSL